jgi:hypothetical protein
MFSYSPLAHFSPRRLKWRKSKRLETLVGGAALPRIVPSRAANFKESNRSNATDAMLSPVATESISEAVLWNSFARNDSTPISRFPSICDLQFIRCDPILRGSFKHPPDLGERHRHAGECTSAGNPRVLLFSKLSHPG